MASVWEGGGVWDPFPLGLALLLLVVEEEVAPSSLRRGLLEMSLL